MKSTNVDYAIIANFTRSFDYSHINNDRIHLISSTCLIKEPDLETLTNFLSDEDYNDFEEDIYVFALFPKEYTRFQRTIVTKGTLKLHMSTIEDLISHTGLTKKNDESISELFGDPQSKFKDFNSLSQQSMFIFMNQTWSNVVLKFKLNNIDISGGSSPKRHILHTTDFQLLLNLYKIYKDADFIKHILYTNYKDPILSSSIPLDYYKIYENFQYDLLKKSMKDIPYLINNIPITHNNLSIKCNSHKLFEGILIDNFKCSCEMLVIDIKNNIKKEINTLNDNQKKLTNELGFVKDELNRLLTINEISTVRMSNKEKKKHKKERTLLNQKLLNTDVKTRLEGTISNLNEKIESIKDQIINKKNELEQFEKNCSNLTLLELCKLQSKSNHFNLGYSLKKSSQKGLNSISGIRQYHSYSRYYSTEINKLNFNIDSPVYLELQRIIKNSNLNEETQMKIEQFLSNQGSLLFKNRINQTLDINYYKLNPNILNSLKNSIDDLDKLINNYKFNIKAIKIKDNMVEVESRVILSLKNEDIISQLLGRFLRIISNNNLFNKNTNCTELACDLGQSLLYLFFSNEYKKFIYANKDINSYYGLSNFVEDNYQTLNNLASDSILIHIGLKFLNFLEEVNLIHSELYVIGKNHKNHIFVCNKDILDNIGKYINLLDISYKIPMIVKPKEYSRDIKTSKDKLGGFLLNDKEYLIPMIIKNSELKDQSIIENDNIIFDMVNNISSVGFKINIPVLDFILERGLEFGLYIDPNLKHDLENKINKGKKLTLIEKKTLDSFLSRKQLEMNILGLALIFKNVPEFYIPVRIDNRGRLYCMVDYLHYQGIELAKSLLLFSKGEKVFKYDKESIDYLKIFGANCFGNGVDKKSYTDRVEWVTKNEYNILNFRNGILIKEADSKLLFIAFCFEYTNYYNSLFTDDTFFISHFPIQLDATCNGYQHLSLLTGDEPLAKHLNLISGDIDSIPKDFYSFVALKLNDYLKIKLTESQNIVMENKNKVSNLQLDNENLIKLKNNIESCRRLLVLNKNRQLVKLPIMVKPYNATLFQMVNYIKEQFECVFKHKLNENEINVVLPDNLDPILNDHKVVYVDKNNPNIKLINNDLFLLVTTIEQVIYNEFPKLKEFNNYLNRVASICSILNITITWALPSGLNVNQFYLDSEAIRLKPYKFRKNTYNLKIKTNKINKAKQIRALMPNLIHSLDAASLSLTVDMFFKESKGINFFAIHDCFATTCNKVVDLIKIIKLVYIKIYSEDSYLKKFDQGIIDSIKLHYGKESFNDETKMIKLNEIEIQYPDVDDIIIGKIKANKIMSAQSIIN